MGPSFSRPDVFFSTGFLRLDVWEPKFYEVFPTAPNAAHSLREMTMTALFRMLLCYRYLVLACMVLMATVATEYLLITARSRSSINQKREGDGLSHSADHVQPVEKKPRKLGLSDVGDADFWRRYQTIEWGMTKEDLEGLLGLPVSIVRASTCDELHFWTGRGGDRCVVNLCHFPNDEPRANYRAYLPRGETCMTLEELRPKDDKAMGRDELGLVW
jgi:hypothetical protein